MPQWHAMPRHNKVEGSLILNLGSVWPMLEIAFGKFAFPNPFVLSRELPKRIRRRPLAAIFFDQASGDGCAHLFVDRRRVFAALAKGFKEALTDRRYADVEFSHPVIDDGVCDGRKSGCFVLDDLQCAEAGTLFPP